jgi:hypothetical protein
VDLKKLSLGDQIIGGSGIVLFIASFLTWFKAEIDTEGLGSLLGDLGSAKANGWDVGFLGWFPVLLGLLMVAYVAVRAFAPQVKLPDLPLPWNQVLFIVGCVAAVLLVLKFLIGEDDGGGVVEISRGIGLYLGVLAGIGLAVGGYFKWKEPAASNVAPTAF